jgi:hypothetical protein
MRKQCRESGPIKWDAPGFTRDGNLRDANILSWRTTLASSAIISLSKGVRTALWRVQQRGFGSVIEGSGWKVCVGSHGIPWRGPWAGEEGA